MLRKSEVMGVFVIVGILLLMAIPGLSEVKKKSAQEICMANMKQIYSAIKMFAEDHNGEVIGLFEGDVNDGLNWWPNRLMPYVDKNAPVWTMVKTYQCPSNDLKETAFAGKSYSYGLNFRVSYNYDWSKGPRPKFTAVKNPAKKALLVDAVSAQNVWALCTNTFFDKAAPEIGAGNMSVRHDGGLNILFFDGHVEYRKKDKVPTGETNSFWDPFK